MVEFIDHLYFLNKMSNMLVPEALLLEVLFDGYFLSHPLPQKDLPIATLADGFDDFDLFLGDKKS